MCLPCGVSCLVLFVTTVLFVQPASVQADSTNMYSLYGTRPKKQHTYNIY